MKKGIITLLVLLSVGSFAFAGNKGNGTRGNGSNRMSERMDDFLDDATIIKIDGTLKLVNGELATLVSGKVTYTIMAPIDQLVDLKVKNGMKVILEGAEFTAPLNWDGTEKFFIVTKITIDGKTTEIEHDHQSGMFGFGHGMMGNNRMGFGFNN